MSQKAQGMGMGMGRKHFPRMVCGYLLCVKCQPGAVDTHVVTCHLIILTRALGDEIIAKDVPPRPLTSLKWPYVPEESAYADPLKRDDPKPLLLAQYGAIGSSTFFYFFL